MKIVPIPMKDAFVIETPVRCDRRGQFARLFCREELDQVLGSQEIQQINYSVTAAKGAIRGMHFQYPPGAEGKFVRCLRGSVFDVMIDLRKGSDTFRQWHGEILSAENMNMLYIPKGFAHGFQTLEADCQMLYLHTEFYNSVHEGGILYSDPAVAVQWPLAVTEISDRDKNHPLLLPDFEGLEL